MISDEDIWRTSLCNEAGTPAPPHAEAPAPSRPRTLAIVGCGQMGRGIAQAAVKGELEVLLLHPNPARAAIAAASICTRLRTLADSGKLSAPTVGAMIARLHAGPLVPSAMVGADFVIEAAPEDLALKKSLFHDLDDWCQPEIVLASNTSSLSITALAAETAHPERVVGMHFFHPVHAMELVEMVRGLATSDTALAQGHALAQQLGKFPIDCKDSPGFIVNRALNALLNEACRMVEHGVATFEDIDRAVRLGLRHPLGPFALMDLIGLDTALAVLEELHRATGDRKFRPTALLKARVAAGDVGRKVGHGFYDYPR